MKNQATRIGFFAEMPHIGVQRFATRDAQHHRTQNDEGGTGVVPHEAQRVMGADGPQNGRIGDNVRHPQCRNAGKPHQGDRSEELANAAGAVFLHREQCKQNDQGQRNNVFFEGGRHHFQAFHGRKHRNRRGDHTIAIKQTGAKYANNQQYTAQLGPVFDRLRGQREHGHQAALAVIVRTQHQGHVLDGHDHRQGPDKNRQNAVNVVRRQGHVAVGEDFFDSVQNTGADVAVNNADGTQCERGEG